jgi:hypothetical protein
MPTEKLVGSGVAKVRRKLPRLKASALRLLAKHARIAQIACQNHRGFRSWSASPNLSGGRAVFDKLAQVCQAFG